ncbi:MAG: hypothetical protein KJ908_06215 [Acidobacteria bacterium]|nr:hypothetical protein [Acidobacteriota bacterium]
MEKVTFLLIAAALLALVPSFAQAQGAFDGYMFGDYYYVMNQNNSDLKGMNGFQFRRIYFTFNTELTDSIKMRLRLEMANASFASANMTPWVKDAYIDAKLGEQKIKFGIMASPAYGKTVEDIWGYRHLEKTPLDLFKFASSRDFGIALTGDVAKGVNYLVMFANGGGEKGEDNRGKKVMCALTFKPAEGFVIEVYGDYEYRSETDKRTTYEGFASYSGNWGRIGVLYANQGLANGTTVNMGLFSAFGVIKAGKSVDIIGRVDMATTDGWLSKFKGSGISYVPFANYAKPTFVIAGLSFTVANNFWVIPNIKFATYSGDNVDLKDDVIASFTFFWKFK